MPRRSRDFEIATDEGAWHLRAPTTRDRDAWLEAIDAYLPAERADDASNDAAARPPPHASLAEAAKRRHRGGPQTTDAAAAPPHGPQDDAPATRRVVWETRTDPASGRAYYYNPETRVSTWDEPSDVTAAAADGDDATRARVLTAAPRRASHVNDSLNVVTQFEANNWEERVDPASGRNYYFNAQTGESTWSPPQNAMILVSQQ